MVLSSPFSVNEWSRILHLTVRSLQRYKKVGKSFDPMLSERIIPISHLNESGIAVFRNVSNYTSWLETKSIALGGDSPKELLDTAFGIEMVKVELHRIEHGIFA